MSTFTFNWIIACIAMVLSFLFSIINNTFFTSMIRSLIAFILFFTIGFGIRWLLHIALKDIDVNPNKDSDNKGAYVDMTTPEDDQIPQLSFSESEKDNLDPKKMALFMRKYSED
ncbi:hypothetical protein [Microaerobacter geothermalis]|uniref:hypothetical protein n=1 Tax=Microaerobacter geothermalis TaxID=674972 RepID=UPI001F29ED90|nr:hypothetical protein [Microaerobacter geothermalis]